MNLIFLLFCLENLLYNLSMTNDESADEVKKGGEKMLWGWHSEETVVTESGQLINSLDFFWEKKSLN